MESPPREEGSYRPKCPKCRVVSEETILQLHFPKGSLPVKGFRCPKCGGEMVLPENAKVAQDLASKLNMFESELPLTRKLTQAGNNLAVHIPKEIERLLGLTKGTKVQITVHGDDIIVHPV